MSGTLVMLTATVGPPLAIVLPALVVYGRRTYTLVETARHKLELRAAPVENPLYDGEGIVVD